MKLTTLEQIHAVHGTRYSYPDLKDGLPKAAKIMIVCDKHGAFPQSLRRHLEGRGCGRCASEARGSTPVFIEKARTVHGDRYDYSHVAYTKAIEPVEIICAVHGAFSQVANEHLMGSGCRLCGAAQRGVTQRKTTATFIEQARAVHGTRYDYTDTVYSTAKIKIQVRCKVHGVFFQQPVNHLYGNGCPECSGKPRRLTP